MLWSSSPALCWWDGVITCSVETGGDHGFTLEFCTLHIFKSPDTPPLEVLWSFLGPHHMYTDMYTYMYMLASRVALVVKNWPAHAGDVRGAFHPWVGKIPWRRAWQPSPVFLPGESRGQRSLVGYSPWGRMESQSVGHEWSDRHTHVYVLLCVYALMYMYIYAYV